MLLQMSMKCKYQLNECEGYHDLIMAAIKFLVPFLGQIMELPQIGFFSEKTLI